MVTHLSCGCYPSQAFDGSYPRRSRQGSQCVHRRAGYRLQIPARGPDTVSPRVVALTSRRWSRAPAPAGGAKCRALACLSGRPPGCYRGVSPIYPPNDGSLSLHRKGGGHGCRPEWPPPGPHARVDAGADHAGRRDGTGVATGGRRGSTDAGSTSAHTSVETARRDYGVVINAAGYYFALDIAATEALRRAMIGKSEAGGYRSG